MFCTNCGKQLADEARFCTSCGTAVGEGKKERLTPTASAGAAASAGEAAGDSAVSTAAGATGATGADATFAAAPDVKPAKPANFKAAMDSTRARGKRRMPMIVLVALALALTSAVAFAAHYVYTGYIAPALEESGINAPFYHGPVDEAEELNRLYYEKIQEYIQKYGEPTQVDYPDYGGWYLEGLCYADLMDFGDGVERLVCAYYDKAKEDSYGHKGFSDAPYTVEVWQPDGDGGIELAYSENADPIGNGGMSGLILCVREDASYMVNLWDDPGAESMTECFDYLGADAWIEATTYWGPSDGLFELKKSHGWADPGEGAALLSEDGVIVDENSSDEWWGDHVEINFSCFTNYSSDMHGVASNDALTTTNETIAELAELASAQPASESEEASAQSVDLKAVNAAYDEWLAANGPAGKMEARIDMDDNGVPELLIYLGQHVSEIYTYENGEVVEVTNAESPDQTYRMSMEVTEDHFLFYRISANGGAVGSCVAYKVNGSSLEVQEKLSWEPVDWSSWTTSGLRFTHTTPEGTTEVVKPVDEYYFQQFEDKFTFIEDLGGQLIGS